MYKRILVPLDGSEPSTHGLDEAIRLAVYGGATLRLIHVFDRARPLPGIAGDAVNRELLVTARQEGHELLRQGQARAELSGVKAEASVLASGKAKLPDLIAAEAKDWSADLIVIGTHGRRGIERILWGSDAEDVLRVAAVPVLIVHAPRH